MRTDFGVTQEALAEALDVSTRTVQRWERTSAVQRAVNATRIGRAICALGRCNGDVAARYANALVSNDVTASVMHCPTIAYLTYGPNLTLVSLSDGARTRWPILTHLLGSDLKPIMAGEGRQIFEKHQRSIDTLRTGDIVAMKMVVRGFGVSFRGYTEDACYRLTGTNPMYDLIRYDLAVISGTDYEANRGKVEIIEPDTS